MATSLSIVSWNINGIRAVWKRGDFQRYIAEYQPDILCVQETKASPDQLPDELVQDGLIHNGYHVTYHSCTRRKGYSGVATFSKMKPQQTSVGFGIERFDIEGRVVQSDFDEFVLLNVYFPNGQVKGDEHRIPAEEAESRRGRLQYKLDFYDALFAHCDTLRKQGRKLIVSGDYNTAHKEIDLARPKENINTTGFLDIEREKIDSIIAEGYVDTLREFSSAPEQYTWWSMQQRARERNIGWRIDYHFVTKNFLPKLSSATIHPSVVGSDHCPVSIMLSI
jgi:exodeoxyribonuclease-3